MLYLMYFVFWTIYVGVEQRGGFVLLLHCKPSLTLKSGRKGGDFVFLLHCKPSLALETGKKVLFKVVLLCSVL